MHSDYGLAGSVWTADIGLGLDIARRVRTGSYAINQYLMDFMAPSAATSPPASVGSSGARASATTSS